MKSLEFDGLECNLAELNKAIEDSGLMERDGENWQLVSWPTREDSSDEEEDQR
jgi:hypothetical protein